MIDYCPKCNEMTHHLVAHDSVVSSFTMMCVECGIVWEYDVDDDGVVVIREDESNEPKQLSFDWDKEND